MPGKKRIFVFISTFLFIGVAFFSALIISPTINNLIETTFGVMTGCNCLCTYCNVGTLSNTAGDTCDFCDGNNCDVVPALGINECDPANPNYCPDDCTSIECCGDDICDIVELEPGNCPDDCCGDGACSAGEDMWNCCSDCPPAGYQDCAGIIRRHTFTCVAPSTIEWTEEDCSGTECVDPTTAHFNGRNVGYRFDRSCTPAACVWNDSGCNAACCDDCMGSGKCDNNFCLDSGVLDDSDAANLLPRTSDTVRKHIVGNTAPPSGVTKIPESAKETSFSTGGSGGIALYDKLEVGDVACWGTSGCCDAYPVDSIYRFCHQYTKSEGDCCSPSCGNLNGCGKGDIGNPPTFDPVAGTYTGLPDALTFDTCDSGDGNEDNDGFVICDGDTHYQAECFNGPGCGLLGALPECKQTDRDWNSADPSYKQNCNDYDGWYLISPDELVYRDYTCGWNSLLYDPENPTTTGRGCIIDSAAITKTTGAECSTCSACSTVHICDPATGIISWEECIMGTCIERILDCSTDCANSECVATKCGGYGYDHEFKRGDPPLGWDFCNDGIDNDCDSNIDKDDTDCRHGGLIPCGRMDDDASTDIDETAPCGFCHTFLTVKRVSDFATGTIIFPLMSLLALVGGGFWLTSGGDPSKISRGKDILKVAAIGFAIATGAWMIANLTMVFVSQNSMGDVFGNPWYEIDCAMPACNLNNICEPEIGECWYAPEVCDNCNNNAQCKNDGFCNPVFGDDPDCD